VHSENTQTWRSRSRAPPGAPGGVSLFAAALHGTGLYNIDCDEFFFAVLEKCGFQKQNKKKYILNCHTHMTVADALPLAERPSRLSDATCSWSALMTSLFSSSRFLDRASRSRSALTSSTDPGALGSAVAALPAAATIASSGSPPPWLPPSALRGEKISG
jgi:hypothetical protein